MKLDLFSVQLYSKVPSHQLPPLSAPSRWAPQSPMRQILGRGVNYFGCGGLVRSTYRFGPQVINSYTPTYTRICDILSQGGAVKLCGVHLGQWIHKRLGEGKETTGIGVTQVSLLSYIHMVMIWGIDKVKIKILLIFKCAYVSPLGCFRMKLDPIPCTQG